MKLKISLTCILIGQTLFSDCECEEEDCNLSYCPEECCQGTFSIGGNWLYLRPFGGEVEYARVLKSTGDQTPLFVDVQRKCNHPDFNSGYEVEAFYQSPCFDCRYSWDFRGSFLSFENSEKANTNTSSPNFILPTIAFIPDNQTYRFLSSTFTKRVDFEAINGEFGWSALCDCPFTIRLFAGAQYAEAKQRFTGNYFNPTPPPEAGVKVETEAVQTVKFQGIGPRIGFNGRWKIGCGLGIFGEFATDLLVGKKRGDHFQENFEPTGTIPAQLDFQWTEKFCREINLIPAIEAKVGLFFHWDCFDCVSFMFNGGYRAMNYFDAFQILKVTGNNFESQNSITQQLFDSTTTIFDKNFGLAGWFLGGSLQF